MADPSPEKAVEELTRLLGDPTRRRIYFHVRTNPEALRVSDIAQTFYLHPNVARAHLEKLYRAGLLKVQLTHGRSGRPAKAYAPTDRRLEVLIPRRDYRALADLAIDVLAQGESIEGMTERAMSLGRQWQGEERVAEDSETPVAEAAERVAARLQVLGSEAAAYTLADGVELEIRNCLFAESANRHPEVVCQAHQAMLNGMFDAAGVPVELSVEESVPEGGNACRFSVSLVAPAGE